MTIYLVIVLVAAIIAFAIFISAAMVSSSLGNITRTLDYIDGRLNNIYYEVDCIQQNLRKE